MAKEALPALDAHTDPKTEFFMAASHQLKSPVAIVQWCLQSILENQQLDPATRKMASQALNQADGMSQLLGDMLRVFRIVHRGENVQNLVPINMNKLITSALEQVEPMSVKHQVKIKIGPIEQLPLVLADETYLKQALVNIVDNSIKYSDAGSSVEIGAEVRNNLIEFSVTDHGIGIPEAEQGRLFSEFFRGELAKAKTEHGTGLGLVLVKHIVEGLGGSVGLVSAVGRGSTFTLRIPPAAA